MISTNYIFRFHPNVIFHFILLIAILKRINDISQDKLFRSILTAEEYSIGLGNFYEQ